MGTVQIDGSTPKLTIGNATAEDALILFDGNAQDFHIGLDDTADDLVIGVGSALGTTTALAIDENAGSTFSGTVTVGVDDTGKDVKFFGATSGKYWLWDESADGVVQIGTITVGVNDAGHDVKFFGDAASAYMLWDTSADDLILAGGAGLIVPDGQFTLGSTAVSATAAELNLLDGGTSVGSSITIADADGFVVNDGGTMKTIPATDIPTYVGGGITDAQVWRVTSNFTGDAQPIASNLEAVDTDSAGALGSAMTESSGIFTFPSTGVWLIQAHGEFFYNGDSRYNQIIIEVTTDNSSYSEAAKNSGGIAQSESTHTYGSASCQHLLDVTNTTNVKVRFTSSVSNDSASTGGESSYNRTYFSFLRIGDT
jgi:hypothetical protein